MQTQRASAIEAWTNGLVGFALSWVLMTVWLNYPLEPTDSFIVTISFTALTITRSYIIRRLFHAHEN